MHYHPAMSRSYVKHWGPAELVEGVYAIQNCQLGQTKAGKPFIKCLIADKTGRAPGRMWNTTEDLFKRLPTDGFVRLEGQTQPYQGEMQIIINRLAPHEPTRDELCELLPATEHDVDAMFADVVKYLGSLAHPACLSLADRYLEDGPLMDAFCQAPAASALHHAFLGGLLEHTLSLMNAAEALLPNYPPLNRDIVLLGLFLHDLGKCAELTWMTGFGYSDDGQLVGHIGRGAIMLAEKAKRCEDPELGDAALKIPTAILRALTHIILSHHGIPEYGALKIPATPEAIFISNLDNLDAKMNMALTAADRDTPAADQGNALNGDFTEKLWALGTRLYRPDPTTVADD